MATVKRKSPAQKKRFRVHARSVDYFSIDVFAKDRDEAHEIAERVDGGYFTTSPKNGYWGCWAIDQVDEITDDEPFHPLDESCLNSL